MALAVLLLLKIFSVTSLNLCKILLVLKGFLLSNAKVSAHERWNPSLTIYFV